ncbi:MAG: hypothetical protein Tp158DCM1229571_23 [Prokaryotic dsDNA virus sp.]|nr:MAG: hypothetical protein Tp158DCM1229571_23 [Prokaryotic dsDNA virus sp.]|tara:strand:- start:61821 stop:64145 length:2325 start_codon:yes stop_codon:yes gene_type:complete
MSTSKARLKEIIDAYIDRDGDAGIDTGIVAGHLSQMKLFGIRQGVEFFPAQDNFGAQRKDFIDKVVKYNRLDTRLDSIWDYFICDGKGLYYIRPTKTNYRLYFFRAHEYRSYYNVDGELEQVVIIYSYKVKAPSQGMYQGVNFNEVGLNPNESQGKKKYIRLSIKRDEIEETHSDAEMSFDLPKGQSPGKTTKFENSMGFIPCVEIINNAKGFSMDGNGDFDALADHIVTHDDMVKNIRKNLQFFGNPTLLSSRPKTDLLDVGGDGGAQRPSIAANSGFGSPMPMSRSTFKQDPIQRGVDGQLRVPRVIANLEPNDRVGYIVPDAVSGDQNSIVRQYQEEIRLALGGVDDSSISASATATEYKSIFGRVAATSQKKANSIYTHGLCRCFELIIFQEEQMFKDSLAAAAKIEKPLPLKTGASDEEIISYKQAEQIYEQQLKQIMMACVKAQMIPPGVKGLIPDGDISMLWRWMGPVYQDTTQDILNNSIVVRNLQELGVDSIEALKYLFPSKTDEERAEMLSGFPFRMVNELQGAYSQFSRLIGGMMQTPHPQSPDLPMAADPRLDLTPYLYRTLEALQKEMSYAGRYRPIDPTDEPSTSGSSQQLRGSSSSTSTGSTESSGDVLPSSSAERGTTGDYQLPIKPYSVRPPIPTGDGSEQPMGVGIQPSSGPSGQPGSIPVPGSTITGPGTDTGSVFPGELRSGIKPDYARIGSADLISQPGLLGQLFPNLLGQLVSGRGGPGGVEPGKPDGDRKLRDRSSGDSKPVRSKPGKRRR